MTKTELKLKHPNLNSLEINNLYKQIKLHESRQKCCLCYRKRKELYNIDGSIQWCDCMCHK